MPADPNPLDGYSIIYFGNDWRAENRTSSHHIAVRLARRVPLLYISTPGMRPPSMSQRDLSRVFRKLSEAAQRPQQVGEKMWTITLPNIPFSGLPLVPQFNRMFGGRLLHRAMSQLGFRNFISWFHVPHPGAFAKRLGERLSVYYCIDEYAAFPGVNKEAIQKLDDHLTTTCDLVFFCTKRLLELRRNLRADAIYSPHGVDVDLFGAAMDPSLPVAEPARALRKPIVGFFGNVGAWVDVDLMLSMAKARPDWTFLVVGLPIVDVSELKDLPNVVMPGPQKYETLASWAKAFDVCIAPMTTGTLKLNSNPLKIREYLATGRPVVSTWLPEIDSFGNVARLVRDRDAFMPAVEAAIAEGVDANQRARVEAVRGMSWDARVDCIVESLASALSAKKRVTKN